MSARIEAAARAIHDASGFDPDGIVWPCEACMTRAKVALAAADAVEASELEATRAALIRLLARIAGGTEESIPGGITRIHMATRHIDAARAAVVSHPPERTSYAGGDDPGALPDETDHAAIAFALASALRRLLEEGTALNDVRVEPWWDAGREALARFDASHPPSENEATNG